MANANDPLTEVEAATPAWLTAVLTEQGFLNSGTVIAISTKQEKSTNAKNGRLRVTYSDDATGECPPALFLKIYSDKPAEFGNSEVLYYTAIHDQIQIPPMPKCFHTAYRPNSHAYHLLLEDLTESHRTNFDIKPTLQSTKKTVEALAQLHASWWQHPNLGQIGTYPTDEVIDFYLDYPSQGMEPLLAEMGETIPIEWHELVRAIFAKHGRLLKGKAGEGRHLTCIHGDPNPGNILSAKSENDRAYLIDRQLFEDSLSIWLGVSDLAYMMVHWWEPEDRRRLERPLLKHYHQALAELGVKDYSFEQLWADYRLCAMQSLYVVASWCADDDERSSFKWVWLPQFNKTMTACADLNVLEMLS